MSALVGVIMGSRSDWETMSEAVAILERFNIPSRGGSRVGTPYPWKAV